MCQRARLDPHDLVQANLNVILKNVTEALDDQSKVRLTLSIISSHIHDVKQLFESELRDAAYNAVSTLVFVNPEDVIPRILDHMCADLDAHEVNALTDVDLGIWRTPEGTAYVDGKFASISQLSSIDLRCQSLKYLQIKLSLHQKRKARGTRMLNGKLKCDNQLRRRRQTGLVDCPNKMPPWFRHSSRKKGAFVNALHT